MKRRRVLGAVAALATAGAAYTVAQADPQGAPPAATPIQHVVVIFGENESFDHYFGTYPHAMNAPGDPVFLAKPGTPAVDSTENANLLSPNNPNSKQPLRLGRADAVTCGNNHNYGAEQLAFNNGAMNRFVENTGGTCFDRQIAMAYYDGNTVTGLWNVAQNFAMSDHHFGSTFGPSTIGAINIVSANTHGIQQPALGENGTLIANSQPAMDDCSAGKGAGLATMSGRNIGDLMNAAGVTWGWFAGGFRPTSWAANGDAVCAGSQTNAAGAPVADYFPHHEPFQYYASTANRHHVPPSSVAKIGQTDEANHQYDLTDFDKTLAAGNLPQVSFLKAVSAEDSHSGYSGPLDEQHFVTRVLNALQASPEWSSTAVFLAYDDSDGWYDHAYLPPQQGSRGPSDALNGAATCGPAPAPGDYGGRCGPGPRLPLLVVSPWAKQNFVDTTQTEQASITRFIEDNWGLGRLGDQSFDARAATVNNLFDFNVGNPRAPKVFLNATTGEVLGAAPAPVAIAPARADPGPRPVTTATPTATAFPTAVPTPKPTVTPTPKPPKVAVTLSCKVSGSGKKFKVTCTGKGADAAKRTSLKFEIRSGKKVLASAKATLSKKKASVTIKAKKTIKKGKYTLRITLSQPSRTTITTSKTIRLK